MVSRWKKNNAAILMLLATQAVTAFHVVPAPALRRSRKSRCLAAAIADGFDSNQMDALVERGELEAQLMEGSAQGALGEEVAASMKKKKTKKVKKKKAPSASMAARTLKQDGVVRLTSALSASTAASLREEVLERRTSAYAAIDNDNADWRQYFADVLLKSNRCDLLLPLKGSAGVQAALRELLVHGTLVNVLLSTLGEDATLYELAALISEPGSPRQPVHPDNPHQEHPPLLTCFVALQDIDATMGPTTFLPKTNTAAAHAEFDDIALRDGMLAARPNVVALLQAGDASLFDSRTMHCGGANEGSTRALFYFSFRNPKATMPIGNVGSMRADIKTTTTLGELRAKLGAAAADDGIDPFDDEQGEAQAVDEFRLAAAQGNADAQFNLGLCYRRGEGVEKNDVEAVRWFRLAAEQGGGALAQCNLGFSYYLGEGVEKDEVEAARWFDLAAAQGLAHAQHNLGFCYSTGVGVPAPDLKRAAELFQSAAEQGHPGAQQAYDEVLAKMQAS